MLILLNRRYSFSGSGWRRSRISNMFPGDDDVTSLRLCIYTIGPQPIFLSSLHLLRLPARHTWMYVCISHTHRSHTHTHTRCTQQNDVPYTFLPASVLLLFPQGQHLPITILPTSQETTHFARIFSYLLSYPIPRLPPTEDHKSLGTLRALNLHGFRPTVSWGGCPHLTLTAGLQDPRGQGLPNIWNPGTPGHRRGLLSANEHLLQWTCIHRKKRKHLTVLHVTLSKCIRSLR